MNDYADDEKGKLSIDLKRSVLSQEGIYNLRKENDNIIKEILKY